MLAPTRARMHVRLHSCVHARTRACIHACTAGPLFLPAAVVCNPMDFVVAANNAAPAIRAPFLLAADIVLYGPSMHSGVTQGIDDLRYQL